MPNKKIINATKTEYDDIQFKSKLECNIYKCLVEQGIKPQYEAQKFVIWKGFKPEVPFYEVNKKTKMIGTKDKKIIDITYTPDLTFLWKDKYIVFVEVKPNGFQNDVYPYKEKLFRKYMETHITEHKPIFVRVGSRKNMLEFLDILKTEYEKS